MLACSGVIGLLLNIEFWSIQFDVILGLVPMDISFYLLPER